MMSLIFIGRVCFPYLFAMYVDGLIKSLRLIVRILTILVTCMLRAYADDIIYHHHTLVVEKSSVSANIVEVSGKLTLIKTSSCNYQHKSLSLYNYSTINNVSQKPKLYVYQC